MKHPARVMRRCLTLVTCALLLGGCSHMVEVPRDQFAAASHDEDTAYHIRTLSGDEYQVGAFQVSDTMLVITELSPTDPRYGSSALPIALHLADIQSVTREKRRPMLLIGALAVGAFIAAVAVVELVTGGKAFTD